MTADPDETPAIPPLFLFGHERSGTTLLSMMVGAHPLIAVPLATAGLWYDFFRRLGEFNHLQTPADVAALVDALLASERIRLWDADIPREEVVRDLPTGSYPDIVARFHACYARLKGKPGWGNIDIATLDDMDLAARWFPEARFIHIVRDGRDVALSNQTMPFSVGNIAECAEKWRGRLYANLKMGAILGPGRYLVVRYEDLVLEPEAALREICHFAGVAYAPEMLEYREAVDAKVPENRRFLWPDISEPPKGANAYRWKAMLGTNRRIVIENAAGDMLRRLGYETYEKVPKRLGAYLLELWYFLDRGHRAKRWLRRMGLERKSRLEREWARKK